MERVFLGELKHSFGLINPKVVFASASCIESVIAVCEEFSCVQHIVTIDNCEHKRAISLKNFIEKYSKSSIDILQHVKEKVNTKELTSMIFQSSGTTGAPKGYFSLISMLITTTYLSRIARHIRCGNHSDEHSRNHADPSRQHTDTQKAS
jgi:long-subunit acyl-CoA synthetase (AMP-forming)